MKWAIEAVVKNGMICPLEPLPPEWTEGSELAIQLVFAPQSAQDLETGERQCCGSEAVGDPEDDARLEAALARADEQAKGLRRRACVPLAGNPQPLTDEEAQRLRRLEVGLP